MANREDKAVAVGPVGAVGVVYENTVPKDIGHRREGHGGSWVAGIGLLDGVHGKGSDSVDDYGVE